MESQIEDQSPEFSSDDPSSADDTQQSTIIDDSCRQNITSSASNVQSTTNPNHDAALPTGTGPIRVPGTYPPEWLPDHETNNCMSCDNLFTLIKRRHHCRSCGKIFCGDCCRYKAKLLYLDNKEARVCRSCRLLIENTLFSSPTRNHVQEPQENNEPTPSSSTPRPSSETKVQGVLKTVNQSRPQNNDCNTSSSSSSEQQQPNKQVIFADGIRPGTDLSEPFPYPISGSNTSSGPSSANFSLLSRQSRQPDSQGSSKKSRTSKSSDIQNRDITVCDELGYLPPIVINRDAPIMNDSEFSNRSSNSLTSYIINQFRSTGPKRTIQASMESRSCPLNGVVRFEDISGLVGIDQVVTFLLLRDYYLRVKITGKHCCMNEDPERRSEGESGAGTENAFLLNSQTQYWCFASDGLARFGQAEIVLVIDKDSEDSSIPRDIFKIYLTLHELALRRQSLENLGNLLFQDGLFGSRGTAGLLFVKPMPDHCLQNLIIPEKNFLVALILQRWEVPWSKVFPVRLLLRLGHKFGIYPYPLVSLRVREPVYYEVGHTIISILGDFRNFRYGINHVDGLKIMLNKATKKVLVQLDRSSYQQFNKVLDSSNNEHVLAWSSYPFMEAQGHLVSVQNEEGNYETVEFYRKTNDPSVSFDSLESSGPTLGASFIIFSGALKVDQSGQSAKISVVEDGLLIQIQSCTMSALKNAIHYMHHFDIDCESEKDPFNRVEIEWQEGA